MSDLKINITARGIPIKTVSVPIPVKQVTVPKKSCCLKKVPK